MHNGTAQPHHACSPSRINSHIHPGRPADTTSKPLNSLSQNLATECKININSCQNLFDSR